MILVLASGLVLAILVLSYLLIYNNWRAQNTIAELLDRIMTLQALPPVSRPLPQIEKQEEQEPRSTRRPEKDRIRFGVRA